MEISKLNSQKITNSLLFCQKVGDIIKRGGIIIFPTDTVYGLLADATNKKSVKKIFKIKKRMPQNYLPIFIDGIEMVRKIAKISKNQAEFLRKVWPGRVTVVLKRKRGIKLYGINRETIALRIPKFQPLNYLLKTLGSPLTATSANISGKLASGNIKKVLEQFIKQKEKPDFVVDAGNLPKRKTSIVIDLTKKPPKILRV